MEGESNQPPGVTTLLGRIGRTGVGLLRNRAELLSVEWQEEKGRLIQLLIWSLALLFLAVMALVLITATVVILTPEEYRAWVLGGFSLLYLLAAVGGFIKLKSLVKKEPFSETVDQLRKDAVWLETQS